MTGLENAGLENAAPVYNAELDSIERRKCKNEHSRTVNNNHT